MNNIKSWDKVEQIVSKIASKYELKQDRIFTKSRGGLVPARLLADIYDCPKIVVDAKEIPNDAVFVDDIFDTGKTYQEISGIAKGEFTYIALYARKGKKIPSNLIFAEETEGDEYIVFPWDKAEYYRNSSK